MTRSVWNISFACLLLTTFAGCSGSSSQKQALSALNAESPAEAVFDNTNQVRELATSSLTNQLAAKLVSFPHLAKLTVAGDQFGDQGLEGLPALAELTSLKLDGTQVTDVGLIHLVKFPKLGELSLGGCGVTDEGLKSLASLTELRHLNLNKTQITGSGLSHLTALDKLEYLSLQETELNFDKCSSLAGMKQLKTLHVSKTKVDGTIVQVIADLPALERLYLNDTDITDDDIPGLANALAASTPKLKGLFFDRTKISDASVNSFQPLAKLPELSLVHIINTRISFDGHVKLREILPEVNLMSTH